MDGGSARLRAQSIDLDVNFYKCRRDQTLPCLISGLSSSHSKQQQHSRRGAEPTTTSRRSQRKVADGVGPSTSTCITPRTSQQQRTGRQPHTLAMAPDPKLLYYVKNVLADRPLGRCVGCLVDQLIN